MSGQWPSPQAVTVITVGVVCGLISVARYVLSSHPRRKPLSFFSKCCVALSSGVLASGVGSAIASGLVERLSPWQVYGVAVLASASVDVTSLRQMRTLLSTTLRGWLALLESKESANTDGKDE